MKGRAATRLLGAPATAASRLATLGGPGDIVISQECQRLLSPFVNTIACAPVVLDPGAASTTPFRVTGLTGLETRLEASARSGLTPYVGRHSDLALLERHVERARSGEGRVVEIVGEAGLGKSRLIFELRRRLQDAADVTLLQGRCRAFGDVAPYGPFIEIVRTSLRIDAHRPADPAAVVANVCALDASLESFVPLYLHLLSLRGERYPLPRHLQGEHLQAALVDALAAFFTAVSQRTTVVVLFEDWHWADSASRAALARIREIVPIERLLVHRDHAARRGGAGCVPAGVSRLALEPLDLPPPTAIIEAGLGAGHVSDGACLSAYSSGREATRSSSSRSVVRSSSRERCLCAAARLSSRVGRTPVAARHRAGGHSSAPR